MLLERSIKMQSNKVVIVTGANKGLGFEIVKKICEKKYGVIYLTSRDRALGLAAIERLEKIGVKARYHQLDVTNEESINKFCVYLKQNHCAVNILINNAGVLFQKDDKGSVFRKAEITLDVNFFSLVNFTEAIMPMMEKGSRIINISSSSGHLSRIPSSDLRAKLQSPDLTLDDLRSMMNNYLQCVKVGATEGWGDSSYVVSKVGVNAYTFLLHRNIYNKGIKAFCVHPGYVQSDMTGGKGTITPKEAAILPTNLALGDFDGGVYVWHDGSVVPWDGPDPRVYIDGIL